MTPSTESSPPLLLPALIAQRAAGNGGETILRAKQRGIWHSLTWAELSASVGRASAALRRAGVGQGDVVAILSGLRLEAVQADLAILGCGAVSLAIDPEQTAGQVCHQLASSRCGLVFVENEEQLDKVLSIRDRCPSLARIVLFDMKGLRDFADKQCAGLADFLHAAGTADSTPAIATLDADHPAIMRFPRHAEGGEGRVLTHGDIMHMITAARPRLAVRRQDERLAVLQLADITERVWGLYLALDVGCVSNYPERTDTIDENLRELQPTVLGADAALWDHLHAMATTRAAGATLLQRAAYRWALATTRRQGVARFLADLLVLRAVRREFGLKRLRVAYVGGAAVAGAAAQWAGSLAITVGRVDKPAPAEPQPDHRYRSLTDSVYV